MAKKKTKRIKSRLQKPILDDSETLVLSKNKPHLTKKLLDQILWLKDRYLLPGEEAEDYDLRLKALVDSIEIHNALDAILVKDIHDEMCEMHRLRSLKNILLLDGMRMDLNADIRHAIHYEDIKRDTNKDSYLEIKKFIIRLQNGEESVIPSLLAAIKKAGLTLAELQVQAYRRVANNLVLVDNQMVRHQKNIREFLKLIEMRRNNALARQRLEQEMERLSSNTIEAERDKS